MARRLSSIYLYNSNYKHYIQIHIQSMQAPFSHQIRIKKIELIKSYQQKQQFYKNQINRIRQESNIIQQQIINECQKISIITSKLREKGREYISQCVQSLNSEVVKQMVDIKELANYLKSQKELLKRMSSQSQKHLSKENDIHRLLSRSKLQTTLRIIKKKQIQDEIKYLETNVIVKGNLIYNTALAPTITISEEKQLNQQLLNRISQLERLITLSIPCNQTQNQTGKVKILTQQADRLKQCEHLLNLQYQKLGKLIKYFQGVTSNCLQQLPFPIYELDNQIHHSEQVQLLNQNISEIQLTNIVDFSLPEKNIVGRLSHKFEDWEEDIQNIRKKYRKIEKLL